MQWMILALLAGCGEDVEPPDPITPLEGSWSHDTVDFSDDGCRLSDSVVLADFTLSDLSDDGFTYTDDTLGAVQCALGAVDFSCTAVTTTDTFDDTVLTLVHTASGTLSDESSLSRTVDIDGDCTGSLCGSGFGEVDFPCTTVIEATASAR